MDTEVRSPQKNQQLSLKIGQRSYLNRDENENKAGNGSIKLNTSKKEKKNRESGKKSYDKKKPGTAHSPSAASLMKKSKSRMDRDPHGSKTSIKIPLNHERSPNSDHNRTSSTDW